MTSATHRDIASGNGSKHELRARRQRIAVIRIDRYTGWKRLHNAVNDAQGVLNLFSQLGFEPIGRPLFDEMATGDALRRLATDDLAVARRTLPPPTRRRLRLAMPCARRSAT
jgi:hypothetical protein